MHSLAADKDVKCAGIQDDVPILAVHVFPEFGRVVMADAVQIDDARYAAWRGTQQG